MSVANPKSCAIGKTFYFGPNFLLADFTINVGGVFTVPSVVSFTGNTITDHIIKSGLVGPGLTIIAQYVVLDSGNSSVGGSIWVGGGVGVKDSNEGTDPSVALPIGSEFVAHATTPRFVIKGASNASPLYESGNAASETSYACTVTITIASVAVGGYYPITVRLQVPALSIDSTQTEASGLVSSSSTVNLFINGPISTGDSAMSLVALYLVGTGLSGTCLGAIPTASEVLRDSTGKLTHAGIYKFKGSVTLASKLHGEFKDAT